MNLRNHPLRDLIDAITKQTELVGIARNAFLSLEAELEILENQLIDQVEGRTEAEKRRRAKATPEWAAARTAMSRAKSVYKFREDELSIMNKEYQAQYLELKDHENAIRRQ